MQENDWDTKTSKTYKNLESYKRKLSYLISLDKDSLNDIEIILLSQNIDALILDFMKSKKNDK